jgi:hypothetical protein
MFLLPLCCLSVTYSLANFRIAFRNPKFSNNFLFFSSFKENCKFNQKKVSEGSDFVFIVGISTRSNIGITVRKATLKLCY